MPNQMQGRLQTMPPRSGMFFVAIVLTPMAIGLLLTAPRSPIAWVVILAGALSFFDCIRRLKVRYDLDDAGINRQRLGGSDQIAWQQVEAVGSHEIYSKIGIEAIVVRVYSQTKSFRPMLRPEMAALFLKQLHERCPKALQIDEDTAQISTPLGGDKEARLALVARHKLRLRIEHAFSLAGWSLLFVPCIISAASVVRTGIGLSRATSLAAITTVIFLALASTDITALWHLRKR